MIKYHLKCSNAHEFESWFASSAAYDKLAAAGQVTCPHCGAEKVEKRLMAPSVAAKSEQSAAPAQAQKEPEAAKLAQLRAEIEANSEDVGKKFAQQARAMHDGEIEKRQIHGEARLEDAKALLEDGVPVLPLPFVPKSKAH